jgi:periplasmic copper chaperone A
MSRSTLSRTFAAVAAASLAAALATGTALAADPASPAPTAAPMPSMAAGVTVQEPWARAVPDVGTPGAAYLILVNGSEVADALLSASSPAAGTVELHETTPDASGMMAMHPVERIDLPAGATVALQPGGYHIMLIDLVAPLVEGELMPLTLTFEHAPAITVEVHVVPATGEPMPSMGMPGMGPDASASPAPSMAGM